MSTSDFRDLEAWKKARAMAILVYEMTDKAPLAKDFGLRGQMRRAAVSVCSNIAEGNERNTDRDTVSFLYMAKGSAAELIAQAEIALGVGHLDQNHARRLTDASEEVSKMLGGLIKYREKSA